MIKRIIEISSRPVQLRVRLGRLIIHQGSLEPVSIPCEDVGFLVIDHAQATFSTHVLTTLANYGAGVVFCGPTHLPESMVLPFSQNRETISRLHQQITASVSTRKRLWQQIVRAKIHAQAANLPKSSDARIRLERIAREVRSGDPANAEAQAARIYWRYWLGGDIFFHRDPKAEGLNVFLNYGYSVLRAAVARALVVSGLLPALGIHHCNRANGYCLADDLVEPLRPLIDDRARGLWLSGRRTLDRMVKAELLGVLQSPVRCGDSSGPLMVAVHRMTASLAPLL
ncbi:MAG: type II CRISPR-associated endonuclease Cas1 [Acidobacteriota bacterium]